MLNNNDKVYFIMNGYILNGRVIDKKEKDNKFEFSIEGYAGCGGQHIISSSQIHRTIFLSEEEARQYIDNPQMYIQSSC